MSNSLSEEANRESETFAELQNLLMQTILVAVQSFPYALHTELRADRRWRLQQINLIAVQCFPYVQHKYKIVYLQMTPTAANKSGCCAIFPYAQHTGLSADRRRHLQDKQKQLQK